jgi:hypothetical protein
MTLLQMLGVIGIFTILIYALYQKKLTFAFELFSENILYSVYLLAKNVDIYILGPWPASNCAI